MSTTSTDLSTEKIHDQYFKNNGQSGFLDLPNTYDVNIPSSNLKVKIFYEQKFIKDHLEKTRDKIITAVNKFKQEFGLIEGSNYPKETIIVEMLNRDQFTEVQIPHIGGGYLDSKSALIFIDEGYTYRYCCTRSDTRTDRLF